MEKPLPAYAGSDPFVFVCYAHLDSALVYPEILQLQTLGFRIWYDDGISPGSEWSEAIAQAIETCQVFLYYITPNAVASEHCRREVNFALEQSCSMLAVHLTETNVPSALKLSLSHRQAILKYNQSAERYSQRLENALKDAATGKGDPHEDEARALSIGDFVLDIPSQRLQKDGEEHLLDPKDMSVLLHIAEAAPGLVSTEELLARSWPGAVVGDNVVHQVIGHLRKALGDSARAPTYLETLPRRGYRLLQPVSPYEPETIPVSDAPGAPEIDPVKRVEASPPTEHSTSRLPIRAILLACALLALLVVAALMFTTGDKTIHPRSIAILPFVDLTGRDSLDTLGDRIPRSLVAQLNKERSLRVLGTAASFGYANSDLDIKEIGETLGVAYVVSGTVLKDGNRIRVTVEMVSVGTLFQQWGDILYDTVEEKLTEGDDLAIEVARGIMSSFASDQPTLQLPGKGQTDGGTEKPSLQDLFNEPADGTTTQDSFPTLEDVDLQTFEDLGDVE